MHSRRLLSWIGTALSACAWSAVSTAPAEAFPTTWELKGSIVQNATARGELPGQWLPGTRVRVLVTFETDIRGNWFVAADGGRFFQAQGRPLRIDYFIGPECNPCSANDQPGFAQANGAGSTERGEAQCSTT